MNSETEGAAPESRAPAIPVAVVGSPSTNTELTLDILDESIVAKLVGALVGFTWRQTGPAERGEAPQTAVLGQITSLEMRNRWHEDQTFKNIIKSNRKLPVHHSGSRHPYCVDEGGRMFRQTSGWIVFAQ